MRYGAYVIRKFIAVVVLSKFVRSVQILRIKYHKYLTDIYNFHSTSSFRINTLQNFSDIYVCSEVIRKKM